MAVDLDRVADDWQFALDAARRALDASGHTFPDAELHARRRRLAHEWIVTEHDLAALASILGGKIRRNLGSASRRLFLRSLQTPRKEER